MNVATGVNAGEMDVVENSLFGLGVEVRAEAQV